jgi:hypothetical protein
MWRVVYYTDGAFIIDHLYVLFVGNGVKRLPWRIIRQHALLERSKEQSKES